MIAENIRHEIQTGGASRHPGATILADFLSASGLVGNGALGLPRAVVEKTECSAASCRRKHFVDRRNFLPDETGPSFPDACPFFPVHFLANTAQSMNGRYRYPTDREKIVDFPSRVNSDFQAKRKSPFGSTIRRKAVFPAVSGKSVSPDRYTGNAVPLAVYVHSTGFGIKHVTNPLYTVNGLKLFPRTIPHITACRSNDPFMSLYEQRLWLSECGRQAWPNVRLHRVSNIISCKK